MSAAEAEPYARWLVDRHAQGVMLAATCGGVFTLAATGHLSGRAATTHWFFGEAFRERFPDVRLHPDRMVIDDGDPDHRGRSDGMDRLGSADRRPPARPTVMADTGHFMLVDTAGREQRHFSRFSPRFTHGDETILRAQRWLQAQDARDVSIGEAARRVGLEERTFLRPLQGRHRPQAQRLCAAPAYWEGPGPASVYAAARSRRWRGRSATRMQLPSGRSSSGSSACPRPTIGSDFWPFLKTNIHKERLRPRSGNRTAVSNHLSRRTHQDKIDQYLRENLIHHYNSASAQARNARILVSGGGGKWVRTINDRNECEHYISCDLRVASGHVPPLLLIGHLRGIWRRSGEFGWESISPSCFSMTSPTGRSDF